MKINVLDPKVYNRISAGEVVERPASIVKELVENSIDAGATSIRIDIHEGGIKNITVSDNGCGIEKDDLTIAFLPHATSKIKDVDDLDNIKSLGFRGEALASISSVCQVKLTSKTNSSLIGYAISVNGGAFEPVEEIARSNGTTISCSNLFFNTPVRAKFLRKPKTEESEITHLVEKFMLSHSDISFQYYVDEKQIYNTSSCSMQDIIYTIYGKEVYDNLIEVNYEEDGFKVEGFVTKPKISKTNRTYQTLFVNGRFVENYIVSNAVSNVYESFLMKGRFPVYILSLIIPADCVDVNVHPTKREVKFDNPNKIFSIIRHAVENSLLSVDQIQSFISASSGDEKTVLNYDLNTSSIKDVNSSLNRENQNLNNEIQKQDNLENLDSSSAKDDNNVDFRTILAQRNQNFSSNFEGNSFNENLVDSANSLNKFPREVEIESNSNDNDFSSLETLSLKNEDDNDSQLFFGMSGEKFSREIEKSSQNSFLSASVKDEMKILGTLFKTYIVIELDDAVYFIDQHAAHERLLYDNLVKHIQQNNVAKQGLLAPYTFTVGVKESQSLDDLLPDLKKIGFDIEKNETTYSITSVPLIISYIKLDQFVDEIVKDSLMWDRKVTDYVHSKLCQTACKHAIKAGDTIDKDECAYIIEQVRKGVMLCPHGRPITLVITKHEFEKMFKRIV